MRRVAIILSTSIYAMLLGGIAGGFAFGISAFIPSGLGYAIYYGLFGIFIGFIVGAIIGLLASIVTISLARENSVSYKRLIGLLFATGFAGLSFLISRAVLLGPLPNGAQYYNPDADLKTLVLTSAF